MRSGVSVLRRWGVWCACLVSVAVGSALVWRILTPDALGEVMTGELLALVGLFVLPVLAVCSFLGQRATTRQADAPERSRVGEAREHRPAVRGEKEGAHRRARMGEKQPGVGV